MSLSLQDIKDALDRGAKVTAHEGAYDIIKDELGQYLILYRRTNYCIGLHGQKGTEFENKPNINLDAVTIEE